MTNAYVEMSGHPETTVSPPEWTVVEILTPNRAWKEASPAPLGHCERCGRELWARLYVLENAAGRRFSVGSGCVRTLTGRTLATIAAERTAYLAACRNLEEEQDAKVRRAEFFRVHGAILEHLEKRAAAEHEDNERRLREYFARPLEERLDILDFPNLASFWTGLLDRALRRYSLTPRELRFIEEDMSRGNGTLPAIGTRQVFSGEIIRASLFTDKRFRREIATVAFTVRTPEYDWALKVRAGSHLWAALGLPMRPTDGTVATWIGSILTCKATVRSHDAGGGRIFLTRGEPV